MKRNETETVEAEEEEIPQPTPITMCRGPIREIFMWLMVFAQPLIIAILLSWVIRFLVHFGWYQIPEKLSLLISLFVVSGVFCFGGFWKYLVVGVADYHACVLKNRLIPRRVPTTDSEGLVLSKDLSMEELSDGYHGKWMWQSPTFVDTRKQAVMSTAVIAYSEDGVKHIAIWTGVNKAAIGFLCNLVRNTDAASQENLEGAAESCLGEMINRLGWRQVTQCMSVMREGFQKLFGSDDTLSYLEQQSGASMENMRIKYVIREDRFQESAELPARAQNTAKAVRILRREFKDATVTDQKLLNTILAQDNDASLTVIEGLEGWRGGYLPPELLKPRDKNNKDKNQPGDKKKEGASK